MTELTIDQSESAAGGLSLSGAMTVGTAIYRGIQGYVATMNAIGGTLGNYYGSEMTIAIVAAGNMTA